VADFGRCDWIPGANAVIEGEGIGMVRVMAGSVREKLEAVDPAARTLRYSIDDEGVPFPATGYRARVKVDAAPGGGSRIHWSCEFEPAGAGADETRTKIEAMYGMLISWLDGALAGR
jgi:hypothetical protein